MANSHDLTQLDANSFEHLVNFLALKVLGPGITGFAQGADGGRDGLLVGEARYPTDVERWSGTWYVQSKFHKPHLSRNSQAWLINEVKKELAEFVDSESRTIPDVWIIATNIDPSGTARTGSFDAISRLVSEALGPDVKFDIWGGRKVLDFIAADPAAASHYAHFLTPGNVLTAMYLQIGDSCAQVKPLINHLILDQFNEQVYTKLEQAGSSSVRPKIHELFVDLPATTVEHDDEFLVMETLVATAANAHKPTVWVAFGDGWRDWAKHPRRARVVVLKGGPGQGKSTAGQFYAQIQRAALLLEPDAPIILPSVAETARELLAVAAALDFAPTVARIPVSIELKDFAAWHGTRIAGQSSGIVAYLCEKISNKIDQKVEGGTLKRAFSTRSWFINFDGLDEVPNDVKDQVADEITRFTNLILPELDADVFVLCTTRPQGYSGQFEDLNAVTLDLSDLPPEIAMKCASGVITFGRSDSEGQASVKVLSDAMESPQVRELMTTPLQSHIMAVVVRDGGRPPEKRWELFENFYQVMKKRESLKNFPDVRISRLLRENSLLLKAIHARLGISLHASAEVSKGAETTLGRDQFSVLARQTTERYVEEDVDNLVDALMEATVERLVFVNTPESSSTVRFDIRQLQEFFAGEFIYSNVDPAQLRTRLEVIGGDSHWREVMHFVVSALIVTMRPTELAIALEVICKLDDSDEDPASRIFRRRLGTGALLALRLLNEGVLEQDRSIRLKFKDAVIPLFAMLESSVATAICSISHPNTISWLLNCMIDALLEYNEAEQIGAAIVLCRRLPDSHGRLSEVKEKIFGSSPKYLTAIYEALARDHNLYALPKTVILNSWFWEETLKLFISSQPAKGLDLEVIASVLLRGECSRSILDALSIPESHKQLVWTLLEPQHEGEKYPRTSIKIHDTSLSEYGCTWKTKTIYPNFEISLEGFKSGSPVLSMLAHTIKFAKTHRIEDLLEVLLRVSTYGFSERILPRHFQVLLPISFDSDQMPKQLDYFRSLSQGQLDDLLSPEYSGDYKLPVTYTLEALGDIDTPELLRMMIEAHPLFALAVWVGGFNFMDRIDPDVIEKSSSEILTLARSAPSKMQYLFGGWGAIFDRYPAHEAELRGVLLEHADSGRGTIQRNTISTFVLNLPTELNFLPLIVQVLLDYERRPPFVRHAVEQSHSISTILAGYGLDDKSLKSIFNNESYPVLHRAAAICCYFSQVIDVENDVASSFFESGYDSVVLTFAEHDLPIWFSAMISLSVRHLDKTSEEVTRFIGKLLHIYRGRYYERQSLQPLLSIWRERSSAPVSKRGVLGSWLSYIDA